MCGRRKSIAVGLERWTQVHIKSRASRRTSNGGIVSPGGARFYRRTVRHREPLERSGFRQFAANSLSVCARRRLAKRPLRANRPHLGSCRPCCGAAGCSGSCRCRASAACPRGERPSHDSTDPSCRDRRASIGGRRPLAGRSIRRRRPLAARLPIGVRPAAVVVLLPRAVLPAIRVAVLSGVDVTAARRRRPVRRRRPCASRRRLRRS